jgi:hypothetical protein
MHGETVKLIGIVVSNRLRGVELDPHFLGYLSMVF